MSGSPFPPGKLPGTFLDSLLSRYQTRHDPSVMVRPSYGFDAAAIRPASDTILIKSDPITFASDDAARYLVAVNANDLACLGGIPRWMTVVALLPPGKATPERVERMFGQLQEACDAEGISLVGGHTEVTIGVDRPLLIGTLLGVPGPTGILQPGKARGGDELYLARTAGIEGTALLAWERAAFLTERIGAEMVQRAQSLLDEPGIAIAKIARSALDTGRVTALHDPTEGGVATAIHEIAEASGLGVMVERSAVPIRAETTAVCVAFDIDPLGLLSSGALLIAAQPGAGAAFETAGVQATRIGVLTDAASGRTIIEDGIERELPRFDADEITRALTALEGTHE